MEKRELDKVVEEAVLKERKRCLGIVLDQYVYWRDVPDDALISQFATGAMGACANVVCRIEGFNMKRMQRDE
jgi:hypothetical protein